MTVSTKGRYGLRLMVELAARHGSGLVLVSTLAESQGISANYIHTIMLALKAAGLVRAARGAGGGHGLARPPSEITALQVVEALEGGISLAECVADGQVCGRVAGCTTRGLWRRAGEAMRGVLAASTLENLAGGGFNNIGYGI